LQQFITPIIKVSKGKKSKTFFTVQEHGKWVEATGDNGKGWTTKYYKGLGTSTSAEAKDYFSHLDQHEVKFSPLENDNEFANEAFVDDLGNPVATTGSDLIDMVFKNNRVPDRKLWLNKMPKDDFMNYKEASQNGGVMYSEFINKEYIYFSHYDNARSIPHVIDGLKPSQRKVLFGCIKRKLTKGEIKVAQLTGYIAEHSAYHHGETSLQQTIVNMAQNFVASNNVNLLTPSGQFGTRRMGGKDAASARYIFTKLEKIAQTIFHPDDNELLTPLYDDGSQIEPEFYVPVIPMVLINGADGIGTGWSSKVPLYCPRQVIENLRRKISGEEFEPMKPYYNGFTGDIEEDTKTPGSYNVSGKIVRLDDQTLLISELPIKKWTQDYKEKQLDLMVSPTDNKKQPEIKDFREHHTDSTVSL
jgi:DNA topoisomerase-2